MSGQLDFAFRLGERHLYLKGSLTARGMRPQNVCVRDFVGIEQPVLFQAFDLASGDPAHGAAGSILLVEVGASTPMKSAEVQLRESAARFEP